MALDQATIAKLYAKKDQLVAERKKATQQIGPVRGIDSSQKTIRCCSRGCMTTAHWRVKGIPYCNIHTVYSLSQMVVELKGDVEFENRPGYPTPIDVMDLLDILYEVQHDPTAHALEDGIIERIEKVMNETFYPNLKRQLDVFNELRRGRVGSTSS
jgi:hypothetical protein